MLEKINFKVSVLIANYNLEEYLEDCIKSILEQSYKNIEIIIIDDGSQDNSLNILKKYKEKIIIVKKNYKKAKIGSYDQATSYFECLKIASGEIVFLCDSDDFFEKTKVKTIVNKFLEKKETTLVFDLPILRFKNKEKLFKKSFFSLSNYWSYIAPTSCISIKRKEFLNNFKSINSDGFPDLWLDFRLCIFNKYILKNAAYVEKYLTYYRQTDTMVSSKFKYLSKNWWLRRSQAHNYVKFFFKENNILYKKNLDCLITNFINYFIK